MIPVLPHPTREATTGPTRTSGAEEELLLVDAETLDPAAAGVDAVRAHATGSHAAPASAHQVTTELQQEQIEVAGPPPTGLAQQVAAIREGRAPAGPAARAVGARAGAPRQRASSALRRDPLDVVRTALEEAHR